MKKMLMKRCSLLLAVSIAMLAGCNKMGEQETPDSPNIIYILADDMGYGDVSAYNENSKIKTPFIDQLAKEGMMFTDAHTSSSVCTPTRYGIVTGRYNWRSRLKRSVLSGYSKALIPSSRTTVASMLQTHEYNTAFIGKWHLGWDWALKDSTKNALSRENLDNIDFSKPIKNGPKDLGFEYSYGHSGSLDMAPYVYVENGMPTEIPDTTTVNNGEYSWWRKGPTASDFIHKDVTPNFFRKSFEYIKEKSKEENPFFLYLPLPSPHTPILPTKEWQKKSGLNPYGDFVMMIDDYIGQLEKVIKEAGIEKNTLVIFTTDNGCSPEANFDLLEQKGHDPSYIYRGHKADIFEGGHRVPFIAKWPGKIKPGMVSDEIICTTDLMATCAEIVGYSLSDDEGEDSYSLLPLFEQAKLDKPLREATVHHSIDGRFAIRQGDWKLILWPGSGGWSYPGDNEISEDMPGYQLYNLKNEPSEETNLIDDYSERANNLKELLAKYIEQGRSTPGEKQDNEGMVNWPEIDWMKN